jgi:hypothetical protein
MGLPSAQIRFMAVQLVSLMRFTRGNARPLVQPRYLVPLTHPAENEIQLR